MSDLWNLTQQLLEASRALDAALDELRSQTTAWASAERGYRHAKAVAYLRSEGRNVQERESNAEAVMFPAGTLGDVRFARDQSEGLKVAALEAVRSRRAQLSAIQTLASLSKAEAEFARVGPDRGP